MLRQSNRAQPAAPELVIILEINIENIAFVAMLRTGTSAANFR